MKFRTIIFLLGIFSVIAMFSRPAYSALRYQDFEPNNGTPKKSSDPEGSPPEYGWSFNGAVVRLSQAEEPIHSGKNSWQVTIPAGPHVVAGTGIPSLTQTYHMNLIPECHDRLNFWIWSDPSVSGEHTVMVKFFDQGKYQQDGIGVWTKGKAKYQQWTQMSILFSQLPAAFDLGHVDKIEFFNYWDGTYYYDDIEIGSAFSAEKDVECLKQAQIVICPAETSPLKATAVQEDHALIGLSEKNAHCVTTLGEKADLAIDYIQMRIKRRNGIVE